MSLRQGMYAAGLLVVAVAASAAWIWWPGSITQAGSAAFLQSEYSYLWNRQLTLMQIVSDTILCVAYLSISFSLFQLFRRVRQRLPFRWVFVLFCLFVLACGFARAMDVVVLLKPLYWLSGAVKLVAAIASLFTALALPFCIPRVVAVLNQASRARETHDALAASEARFHAFMEHNPALAFIKDRGGRMLYMNGALEALWSFQEGDWQGKTDAELWSAEGARSWRKLDLQVLETDRTQSGIDVVTTPDGMRRSFLTHKFPLRVPGGEDLVGGLSIDITEQKEAERIAIEARAEKELLLKEVHHRVKNNLQVICSLLAMQAAGLDDPRTASALRDSQDRVQSMALIHELLYGSATLGDIDFATYVERLLGELLASYGLNASKVRLRVEVSPMRIGIDRAIPCGLILNELISNSLKYAFPDGVAGELLVTLAPVGGEVRLAVKDDGIGLPVDFSILKTRSLGLRIVQILTKQLDGRLSIDGVGGTHFEVLFPAA